MSDLEPHDMLKADLADLGIGDPHDVIERTEFEAHTHANLDHLADIVALLSTGVTGSKIIAGYTFTFNHGVLVGFEAA